MSTTQVPWHERFDLFAGLALVFYDDELISYDNEPIWWDD